MRAPIKVHPLFVLLGIYYLATGSGLVFFSYFVSVVFHEFAHARMARLRGYRLGRIVLMPYGAVLKGGESFPRVDSILIALAGPVANLVIALFIVALWWLVPAIYSYTEPLMWANLSLALFNLLPVFPLDGARVILAYSTRQARTLRRLRIVGIVLSVSLMALMIISIFYTFNITLGIMSVFVMHGAVAGTERELYSHIMSMDRFAKSTIDVLSFRDVGISENAELYRFLECVREDNIVTFHILDADMNEIAVLSEEKVKQLILSHSLSDRFCDVMSDMDSIEIPTYSCGE